MKQALIKKGKVFLSEVPAPVIGPREVLVEVRRSCLSIGTEINGINASSVPIWKKALRQPEKVAELVKLTSKMGLKRTWKMVEEKKEAATPTGYSSAGIVIEVGSKVKNFLPGDEVACSGAQCAFHAEYIAVPENLCSLIPNGLNWDSASTVTMGAIALQGVRRLQPTLGETFVVIGLGLLGLISIQLLRANGCKVICVDISEDRINLAKELGADLAIHPDDNDFFSQIAMFTDGIGADGVIITAASSSDEIVSSSFKICRKKGRVVLVGDVGLNLNRDDFYLKEIDFLISSSYGPGRYDQNYEDLGLDYPVSYVRWTENRNMSEYLRLLSSGDIKLGKLISSKFSINEVSEAYNSVTNNTGSKPIIVLLNYPEKDGKPITKKLINPKSKPKEGRINVAIIGAGAYAKSTHLPLLENLNNRFSITAIVNKNGHKAEEIAKQYGAKVASTNYDDILNDPDIDALIVSTRHNLHAKIALEALDAGKHVLVEKPLSINLEELNNLDKFISSRKEKEVPVLLTGFNRRFSPYIQQMASLIKNRNNPFILNYRMNAGYIPLDHWVHGDEGGGRNIGEACHIYDLFTFLSGSELVSISSDSIVPTSGKYSWDDNFIATLCFQDGSICSLTYTALGNQEYPKEEADLYVDGMLIHMNDYKKLEVFGGRGGKIKTTIQDKGLTNQLLAFSDAINSGGEWPIPWWQQFQVSKIALEIENQIRLNKGNIQ